MSQNNNNSEITKSILSIVPAEKIFVLATTQIERQTESIFVMPSLKKVKTEHLYLLVLISKKENCHYNQIQDQIESASKNNSSLTVIAMEMEMFNEWLGEGHPFAVQTKTIAPLIYDKKDILFSNHKPINENKLIDQRKHLYQTGITKMEQLIFENKLYAASVEGLMTILKASIGLELQTDNVDQLIGYCSMVIKEMPEMFSSKNYDAKPPVERIKNLLESLYVPYKLIKMQEMNIL